MTRQIRIGVLFALAVALVTCFQEVSAQTCVTQAPHYLLTSDRVSLIVLPKSGNVQLVGPGFRYTPNPGFHGEDFFSIGVLGRANKVRGTSTIHVAVSVKE